MCVLAIIDTVRPSFEMVEKMWKTNPDGGGVAWREDGKVHWKKGLDEEEMQEFCATLPLPFIAHFRIASVGGARPILTHPFLISETTETELEGVTEGHVLFHNGHWGVWKKEMWEAAKYLSAQIPTGYWSDTRALAWMAYNYGLGSLYMIDEKVVAYGPSDMEIVAGSGWSKVDNIWVSNTLFNKDWKDTWTGGTNYQSTMCKEKTCTNRNLDKEGFCPIHKKVSPVIAAPDASKSHTSQKAGGTSAIDPFAQVLLLEKLHKEGKATKGEVKRARKALGKYMKKEGKGKRLPSPTMH